LKNAEEPIFVTLEGIVTLVHPLHPQNAPAPMLVTLEGIEYAPVLPIGHSIRVVLSLLNNTPSALLKAGLFVSTVIAVRAKQFQNT
jgi:hypothetical protein